MKKVFILLSIIFFINCMPITSYAKDTIDVTGVNGTTKYENPNDIPKNFFYVKNGYVGNLHLIERKVVEGEESKTKEYIENVDFSVDDYCKWNAQTGYMEFVEQKRWIPDTKTVIYEGQTIILHLQVIEKGVKYTKYASSEMNKYRCDPNNCKNIPGVKGTCPDQYHDEQWVGVGNVVNGKRYFTATHYFWGQYKGTYSTKDTRKYVGIYEGTLTNMNNNKPIAKFSVNPLIQDINRELTYKDLSYDNDDGDYITQREWKCTKIKDENGNTVNQLIDVASTPKTLFSSKGVYEVALRVKDKGNIYSSALWSDWYIKTITIKSLLSVQGSLSPNPSRKGNKISLKIKTKYSPNRIEIKFPKDLVEASKENTKIDVNDDKIIDNDDLNLIQASLNSVPGNSKWNEKYDLNSDGMINELDLKIVDFNIGKDISKLYLEEVVNLTIHEQDNLLITEYEFFLPTNLEETLKDGARIKEPYKFDIKVFRNDGETASTSVSLDVTGSIFDGIRTRMR